MVISPHSSAAAQHNLTVEIKERSIFGRSLDAHQIKEDVRNAHVEH